MPEISRFYGIVIGMYYDDHLPPHFHAVYAGMKAKVGINPVSLLDGRLPPRALALVIEWTMLHQGELLENWKLRTTNQPLMKIEPLK